MIFVGYGDGVKGYRLWNPTVHKIIINKDVIFDELSLSNLDVSNDLIQANVPQLQQIQFDTLLSTRRNNEDVQEENIHEDTPQEDEQTEIVEIPQQTLLRSTRDRTFPKRYDDFVTSVTFISNEGEPDIYKEALEVSDSDKWKLAMKDEMDSLAKNKTWDLVELLESKKVVGCKWVYKLKKGADDTVLKYKAKLVAKGFSQKAGIDFHEIFSPVVKLVSIRILLALVALYDLELEQLDVKTAFLHGDLDEAIFMEQPQGFAQNRNKRFVCKLRKSLYGLRQSPRQWYKKFDSFMVGQNFTRSKYDHCVYFKKLENDMFIILVLDVDDMLVASKSMFEINRLKAQLARAFDMKDLGAANQILGMQIHRDGKNGKLWLSQKKYVEKILQRLNMNKVKPSNIRLASHFKLSSGLSPSSDEEKQYMSRVPYANVVGSLMYAMISTRSDISHAVGVVSRYKANPRKEHWVAVKWVLLYLRGTSDYCITFDGCSDEACGYVDSDFAGDLDKRRSTSGYVFSLAGGAIIWMSKLQNIVALSTTKYIAASHACKEAIWLKGLLGELGKVQNIIKKFCDSQSAIHLAKNPAYHSKTKHIPVKYHFVRHVVNEGGVVLEKVHTQKNSADMFTKPVTLEKLRWCLASLGLQER